MAAKALAWGGAEIESEFWFEGWEMGAEIGRDTGVELVAIIGSRTSGQSPPTRQCATPIKADGQEVCERSVQKNRSDSKTANRFRRSSHNAKARTSTL
jgi:hypothetical protein